MGRDDPAQPGEARNLKRRGIQTAVAAYSPSRLQALQKVACMPTLAGPSVSDQRACCSALRAVGNVKSRVTPAAPSTPPATKPSVEIVRNVRRLCTSLSAVYRHLPLWGQRS